MKTIPLQLVLVAFCGMLLSQVQTKAQNTAPLKAIPNLDLQRYLGTWFEIARLPNSFQTKCSCDVSAHYQLREDGDIDVTNRCRKEDGEMKQSTGKAKRASESEPLSKLKVRFAPAFLSWLSAVWGDYWVLILAPDYSYAVVGEPSRKYLWILSRSAQMNNTTYNELLGKIAAMGYDTRLIQKTCQSPSR